MKIAYLILTYEYANNMKFLVSNLLKDLEADIYIHVDSAVNKNDYFIEDPRVFYVKRHRVTWGGYSMVEATMELLKFSATRGYDYYCLLSGRDFLISSPVTWNKILESEYPKSFLDGDFLTKRWTEKGLERINYYFFYIFKNRKIAYYQNRFVRKIGKILNYKRKIPYDLVPYCGSQWWCLSNNHVRFVFDYLESHKNFYKFYRYVGIPDEQFFQTLLFNNVDKNEFINRSQTYVVMKDGYVVDYDVSDFDLLVKQKFAFGRKIRKDDCELPRLLMESWSNE